MLAEGVGLHPDLLLDEFTLLKDDLEEASQEDIRVIWDALTLSGKVKVKLDPECPSGRVKKTEGEAGWSKLVQIAEMSKGEWVQLRVVGVGQDLTEMNFFLKRTTKMNKLMNKYSSRVGVPVNSLVFLFNGRQINNNKTLKSLEMDQLDVIEVFRM